jgi:hypothetical protein
MSTVNENNFQQIAKLIVNDNAQAALRGSMISQTIDNRHPRL